jgi:hypothetical protein
MTLDSESQNFQIMDALSMRWLVGRAKTGIQPLRPCTSSNIAFTKGPEKAVTWAYSNNNMIKKHKDVQHIYDGCDYGRKVSDSPKAMIVLILEILDTESAIFTQADRSLPRTIVSRLGGSNYERAKGLLCGPEYEFDELVCLNGSWNESKITKALPSDAQV